MELAGVFKQNDNQIGGRYDRPIFPIGIYTINNARLTRVLRASTIAKNNA
jgi:hypothetical protein